MSNVAIKVENLSKAYQLGQIGTGTISRDLERWYARIRGKEDPFLRIGESNNQNTKSESDIVWSLKDINFEIEQGDAVGIIGRNGAGKSTLLKILSKVTAPTTGKISGKGRIASLLEVGTGFHPELSGRENIFLNGAILGMRKKEIQRKLEEIVDFAGIERYLDTPVKRYSSGMYVRLAFAVAAHLESEILIVDEVLAVGDAEFQKKCLGKMGEVSKGEGRTVLFVSHNMASVKALCNRGIMLQTGHVHFDGTGMNCVNLYQAQGEKKNSFTWNGSNEQKIGNDLIYIESFIVEALTGNELSISSGMRCSIKFYNHQDFINLDVTFELNTIDDIPVFHQGKLISTKRDSKKGFYTIEFNIPENLLNAGIYYFNLIFGQDQRYALFACTNIVQFELANELTGSNASRLPGILRPYFDYKLSFQNG